MENLIIRSLEKIRKASRRSEKDLRQACDNVLQGLKSAKAEGVAEHQPGAGAADKYFLPFKLACASTLTKVQGASLDCIEKQIAHGYLRVDENGDVIDGETQTLMDVVIQTICKCKDATNSDNVQLQVIKGLLTAVSSSTCEVHSKSLVMAVQACYHIYLITRNEVNRTTAKACLTQMLHVVFRKMELEHGAIENERMRNLIESSAELKTPQKPGYLGINDTDYGKPTINGLSVSAVTDLPIYPAPDDDNDIALLNKLEFRSLLHQDAFFIFRALCKLAMKTSNDNNNNRDEWELIFSVLDQAGPAFRGSKIFLAQIRTQLCRALIQNCLSNQHEIVCISLRIFMVLVNRFKDHVIFLRIIESSNSSFEHKILVLDVFYRICQDANVVVELFLNYDDTHESGRLFERIVHALERVAQGVSMSSDDSKSSIAQDLKLRKVALASLVGILDSLIKFTDENDRSDSISRSGTMYSDGSNNQRDATTKTDSEDNENAVSTPFDKKRSLQRDLETAFLKFKMKPKNGIEYLISKKHLKRDPVDVASFLRRYPDELDKTQCGDYLGNEKPFNIKVLYAYIDSMDFTRMEFDNAIRFFLSEISSWESADTAFVLGYSIIMLNTDLHNPNIKPEKKMSLPQFVNQCKEIDGGNDIEYDYLAGVYSRIKENAISLKEDDDLRGAEAMLTQFQGKKTQKRIFRSAAAVMLATTDNQSIVELCLRGVRHSIHIAAVESLETPLMTFVACLVKFTGLQEPFAHKGNKEIECMKALVAVALSDGNYLGAVWDSVLAAISQVSRLHFAASENQNGGFSGELKRTKAEEMRSVAQFVMDRIDVRSIDRIFTSSPRISAKAIHFFVAALCKVSLKELNDAHDTQSQPRIFSLQKVVEVADFNISCRGRITWAKIWHELSGYFTSVGCHKEPSIAMYAIDSLKQLSMKFLEKEELEGFQFQKQFLRPFETIVRKSKNPATKELILCVVQHIVLARVDMLKSGFSILDRITKDHFALAAEHDFVGLTKCLLRYSCSISVNISLSALAHVRNCISNLADGAVPIQKNERITFSNIPRHTELWWPMLTGLAQLVTEPRIEVRMRAVQSLFGSLNTVGKQFSEDLWQVIFQQILFRIFDDVDVMAREQLTKGRPDEHSWMQTTCMAALGALIDLFSIYFDILKFLLPEIQDLACIGIVCLKQLFILVGSRLDDEMWDECCKFFVLLNQDTMPSVLIEAKQAMELPVSDTKVPETNEFPKENMNEQNVVSETENTTSKKLLWMQTRLKNGFLPFNEQKVFSQFCFPTLRARHLKKLIGCLKHAYAVAAVFNSSKEYRVAMANAGFMRHLNLKRLPNLLRQETVSLVQLLRVLFRVYKEERQTLVSEQIKEISISVISRYIKLDTQVNLSGAIASPTDIEEGRMMINVTPLLVQILTGFLRVRDEQFIEHIDWLYPILGELVQCSSRDLRCVLKEILVNRVGPLVCKKKM
eukprot:GSMAST32.ASY1.ANO1.2167.1 assembled CDS